MIIGSFILLAFVSIIYIAKNSKNSKNRKIAFKMVLMTIHEMLSYIATIKIFSKEEDESFLYEQTIKIAFKYHGEPNNIYMDTDCA